MNWKNDEPIWMKQWPLKEESLFAAHQLVKEQLQQGHVKLSTSPWNSPIFVIKKKSGKYRLLTDLRAVNNSVEPMGALQPGLPNPAMLPEDWPLLIVDLKDCFFTIPLHPQDTKRFAFTLPALNRGTPDARFEWTVLPQGMCNSPTLCQLYVDQALRPLRRRWPTTVIYHYMDDILFAQQQPFSDHQLRVLIEELETFNLVVAPEKIQRSAPWKYLGWTLTERVVKPQKLTIHTDLRTLRDVQTLLGDLQWLKPVVGISNAQLEVLRPLLKGGDPSTRVCLTHQQKEALQLIAMRVATGSVSRWTPGSPLVFAVWLADSHLLGALIQKKTGESYGVIEWVVAPLQQNKTLNTMMERLAQVIKRGRERTIQLSGQEPREIWVPLKEDKLDWYLEHSWEMQEAVLTADSRLVLKTLPLPTERWMGTQEWIEKPWYSKTPLENAITVFTDAGRKSMKAVATWQEKGEWRHYLMEAVEGDSLQTLELRAVVWTLGEIQERVNIVSDSLYAVGVVQRIEQAHIKEVNNRVLGKLLWQLKKITEGRRSEYFIMHIRSHQGPLGLGEGNQRADELVSWVGQVPKSKHQSAREAHDLFHQNAKGLVRAFDISKSEATAIVRACPQCSFHNGGVGLGLGVNPRGTETNMLWQMDVTHIPEFGQLKYVHVVIDTYSRYIWATAQAGERAVHVTRHLTSSFAVMGVPQQIKTDNGPAYVGTKVQRFMSQWGVKHITGIPHSPTGQAIVERAHRTLKQYIQKQNIVDVQEKLARALFVMNHLCVFGDASHPPAFLHYQQEKPSQNQQAMVRYRDPKTGIWEGPVPVVYWGRGYVAVSTPTGVRWVPSKWIKAVPSRNKDESEHPDCDDDTAND